MKYDFSNDYIAFNEPFDPKSVHDDFLYNMCQSLAGYNVPRHIAACIAESLYARMSNPRLKYHTPVHVLRMIAAIGYEGLALQGYEHMAIWFHDAIYDPTAPAMRNETSSAMFMSSLLHGYVDREAINQAIAIIHATGEHHKPTHPPECSVVMDLDMYGFADDRICDINSNLIKDEYAPIFGEAKFHEGTAQFFKNLIAKGFIFRSDHFLKKYEEQAMKNVERMIKINMEILDILQRGGQI